MLVGEKVVYVPASKRYVRAPKLCHLMYTVITMTAEFSHHQHLAKTTSGIKDGIKFYRPRGYPPRLANGQSPFRYS